MYENLCYNCFYQKTDNGACPSCGYDARSGATTSDVTLRPGTILNGRYLVGRSLGQGGFGITYMALDLPKRETIAIKEFFPAHLVHRQVSKNGPQVYSNTARDEDVFRYGLKKFKEEAETLYLFRSFRHIVRVDSFFYENKTGYFTMEFIDGISLKQYVRRMQDRLFFADVVGIMEPVMLSLDEVHRRGLIHRDISPDNIYIANGGMVKLLDFGAARYYTDSKSKSMTTILKIGFAPPEQYSSRGKQGPWTDVYALAATMYFALTGKTPPPSLDRKLEDRLEPLTTINSTVTPPQEQVMLMGLAVDPARRYQNMRRFLDALQATLPPRRSGSTGKRASSMQPATQTRRPSAPDDAPQPVLQPDAVPAVAAAAKPEPVFHDEEDAGMTFDADEIDRVGANRPEPRMAKAGFEPDLAPDILFVIMLVVIIIVIINILINGS